MPKDMSNVGQWKAGHSGNPKGRPRGEGALSKLLRVRGEKTVCIGAEVVTGQEALAAAVWEFVLSGEVWLMGKRLEAQSVTEWASVVKWLYAHVEPSRQDELEAPQERIVRVVREDRESLED